MIENLGRQVNCTKVPILAVMEKFCHGHMGRNNHLHQNSKTL